jgi:GNAT superfamily N-acetyltransferase
LTPRALTPDDLPALMRLKESAGWNQTEEDWLRLLRLAPGGCFGIDVDGTVAATTTIFHHDDKDVAWVGMVLTLPACRGRGLARRILTHALERCRAVRVGLDATEMGQPLYESLGFVTECAIERWVREPGVEFPDNRSLTVAAQNRYAGHHTNASERRDLPPAQPSTALQNELARCESASTGEAHAYGRPGSNFAYFGPCVSDDPASAKQLLEWFVRRHAAERIALDLFPDHPHAGRLARELGFAPVRHLARMIRRPAAPQPPDASIYAIAGFEYG